MPVLAHDVYTQQPDVGPYVIFPTHAHQVLSNCVHIIAVSVVSYCFARRTENDRFASWIWWANLTWARLLIILVFLDSWFFLAFSGIIVNGVGLSYSVPVCSLGIFGCIFFYAGSKALTYLFLVERVWVVCSAGKSVTRMESRIYRFCAVIVFGYTAIVIVMILGRYASIRDDGVCVIGLHSFATIPLLTYDLFINVLLTSLFLWFLCREQSISERLRRLAKRTAFAALIALTTSCINILILALLHGKQLGWVCLSSCAADVTVNALVLFWVTGGAAREPYWQGVWENKDAAAGGAFAEPRELPPLNFPVSFVADPEAGVGLSRVRTLEAASTLPQSQMRGVTARLVHLAESTQEEFCEGSSKDGLSGHERLTGGNDKNSIRGGKDSGDEKSIVEWDITDSASSGDTHFDTVGGAESDEKESAMQSWRLTLDLEMQRPAPLLHAEQSEPDSPATHETGGSRTRLTPDDPHAPSANLRTRKERKEKKEAKKQRRKQWQHRARRLGGRVSLREGLGHVDVDRPIPAASQSSHLPYPPNGSSNVETLPSPLPPSTSSTPYRPFGLSASSPPAPAPAPPQRTRRVVIRSQSDSLVRDRVSNLGLDLDPRLSCMLPGPNRGIGRPRLSQ